MDLKNLFETDGDERAVSPVIGVILMVAITVILAAVIGAFVIGIGDDQEQVPQASWDYTFIGDGDVEITHEGGDSINADRITVNGEDWAEGSDEEDSITAGDLFESSETTLDDIEGGDEVRIVWTSEGGGSTSTLATSTAPEGNENS